MQSVIYHVVAVILVLVIGEIVGSHQDIRHVCQEAVAKQVELDRCGVK